MVLLRTHNWGLRTLYLPSEWAHIEWYQDYYSDQWSFSVLGHGLMLERVHYVEGEHRVKRAWSKVWWR